MADKKIYADEVIEGYKAFNKDLTCKGFQFEENKIFEEKEAVLCKSGFHFCLNPFDVLNYYDIHNSEFCKVKALSQAINDKNDNSKRVTAKIKIYGKLGLKGFVNELVGYLLGVCESTFSNDNNSKKYAKIGSSGDYAKIGSSGDYAKIGSSGDSAQIGSSGYSAQIGSSGYSAKIGSSGDSAKINVDGYDSVCSAIGVNSKIKSQIGNWITLAEWEYDKEKKRYVPLSVKSGFVDGEILKADVFYKLENWEFVECR